MGVGIREKPYDEWFDNFQRAQREAEDEVQRLPNEPDYIRTAHKLNNEIRANLDLFNKLLDQPQFALAEQWLELQFEIACLRAEIDCHSSTEALRVLAHQLYEEKRFREQAETVAEEEMLAHNKTKQRAQDAEKRAADAEEKEQRTLEKQKEEQKINREQFAQLQQELEKAYVERDAALRRRDIALDKAESFEALYGRKRNNA